MALMLKKFLLPTLGAVLAMNGAACKKTEIPLKAGELSVEEKAKLKLNAINAYEKIVKEYPDSPHAAEARKRLDVLKPPGSK
jgi:TolA-binding protein